MKKLFAQAALLWAVISGSLAFAPATIITIHPAASYAASIEPALAQTFGNEGGFQRDPHDSGNYRPDGALVGTKFGIAAASYPHVDIPNLTIQDAGKIYRSDFWGASRCDEWRSQIVANVYFDAAVNVGQGTMARIIQRSVNYERWPKPPIPVDGKIGPGTVKAINEADQVVLFVHMIGLTHGRYVQIVDANPAKRRYFDEWAIRMKRNVQKAVHQYEADRAK